MAKKGRRYPGVSSIRPGLYRLRVTWTCPKTGMTRNTARKVEAKSPAEAATIRARLLDELNAGAAAAERITLRAFATNWLGGKRKTVARSTARQYATALDHIMPALGDYYLDAITREDVRSWRDSLDAPAVTSNGYLRVLRNVLGEAVRDELLARSPAAGVPVLPESQDERDEAEQHLEVGELLAVLEHIRQHAPQWHALHVTLAYTSARWGEVTALQWGDVDLDGGIVRIKRAQWRGEVGAMKSDKQRGRRSVKVIPLLAPVVDVLRAHRRKQLVGQARGLAEGWVFPTGVGTLHQSTSAASKPLRAALAACGITRRFTIHGYRHTLNGLLLRAAGGEVARALTGHVTPAMTEHYNHVSTAEKRAALVRALGGE